MPARKVSKPDLPTHVALLRGINVGGNRIVSKEALVAFFEKAGCRSVSTYIQSGNVVFAADEALARKLSSEIPARIGKQLGFEPVVVVRSRKAYAAIVQGNPFCDEGVESATLHVGFLAEAPTKANIARLDPHRSPGDRFAVRGSEIYFRLPGGMGRTKLTSAYLDATLRTTCTARNWRTVIKLAQMLGIDAAA